MSGRTVTLSWTHPAGPTPTTYVLEAGSASGRADLALTDTGTAAFSALVATGVPSGTYYFRVRARTANGTSGPTNEAVVSVEGATSCTAVPGAPSELTASVSGTSVSLSWKPPAGGCEATSYIVEAGSGAGLANLATVNTASSSTTFSASGVAPGTYFVRVRALNTSGISTSTSNDVSLTVGGAGCTGVPGPPSGLTSSVAGSTVTLSWTAPTTGCTPTSYFLEAGSATGLSDLAATSTGSTTPSFIAAAVPNGTYFVRVKSVNASGPSTASNEAQVVVGGTSGNPLPFTMFTSSSVSGPWTSSTVLVSGSDAIGLVDPSPILMPDGTILLYYLMSYQTSGDPATAQPNNQWKMGVARSTDNGLSFTHMGTAYTFGSSTTDPFPMLLANGTIRLLVSQGSNVPSVTATDTTGLRFASTTDSGFRSTTGGIPGALRIGSTYYLYACGSGIQYSTSSDGLTFSAGGSAIAGTSGVTTCDPSPIDAGGGTYLMAFKRGLGTGPSGDVTYLTSSADGRTWTEAGRVGAGSVPGLVKDANGVLRIYVPAFANSGK